MGVKLSPKRLLTPDGHGYCNRCDSYKPKEEFVSNRRAPGGIHWYCRECGRKINGRYREDVAARARYRRYGITPEQYRELFNKQKGVCAICHKPETKIHKGVLAYLAVDHDHKTGKVRALLCNDCNSGLGYFKDDLELLSNAIDYLVSHLDD